MFIKISNFFITFYSRSIIFYSHIAISQAIIIIRKTKRFAFP